MKFPLIRRKKARKRLEEALNDMAASMYRHGMHDKYSIQEMKRLILERYDKQP